jgi:hypothetical protein
MASRSAAALGAAALLLTGAARSAAARDVRAPRAEVDTLARPAGPEWFGLYLLGKKAGFTRSEVRIEVREGVRVLVSRQDAELSVTVGSRPARRVQRDEKVYEARPGGRLLSFKSERLGDGGDRVVEGRCSAQTCALVLTSEAGRVDLAVPAPGETSEQGDAARLAAARRGTVSGPQLDPGQLEVRQSQARYRGRRRLRGSGGEAEVSVVEERSEGEKEPSTTLVADDGRVLEVRVGASVVARAEPEAVARRLDAVDLFGLTRVPLPRALPHEVPMVVTLRLRGLPPGNRVEDARQRYQDLPGGDTRLTITAAAPAARLPEHDEPRAAAPQGAWLQPSRSWVGEIDSDAPALRALAREVAGETPGAYAAATRLSRFVHGRLVKALGQSRDRATEVLTAGAGDCTEHALLLTALARAAGVRARPVYGLVEAVLGDGASALYWHAWVEVQVGAAWLALDPTLGQDVADATHVTLGRDSAADVLGLLGGLQVISAAAAPPAR